MTSGYKFFAVQSFPYAKMLACIDCSQILATAEILATKDDIHRMYETAYYFKAKCLGCAITETFKSMLKEPHFAPSSEIGMAMGDSIESILRHETSKGLNDSIRAIIRNEIKQLMKEEAHDPNGIFSP